MPALLSINNYHYRRGGAESVFLDHNELFTERGWEVIPFAMQHPSNLESKWQDYFVDEIEFGESYGIYDKLVKAGKSVYSFEARKKVKRLISETRPLLAHGHNIYHHLSPSILGAIKSEGVPVVLTLHDLKIACPAYKMMTHDGVCERCRNGRLDHVIWNRCVHNSYSASSLVFVEAVLHKLLRSYQRNVDAFIVPSKFFIKKFVEWGWDESLFRHIPNFVDTEQFKPSFKPGNHFVYFGRLSAEKGVATLIKAVRQADVYLKIVGTGPIESGLRKLAGNDGRIDFLGYKSGQDLHDQIRSARAVVLPSEWYENAPISILESYALGKPVIGASIGGIPEMIIPGQTGYCFEHGSVDSLANVLESIMQESDGQVARMGEAARSYVEKQFSTEAYYERCLSVYESLIDTAQASVAKA
jgi:glycosyltransferase involved in cell wall biosynthesis